MRSQITANTAANASLSLQCHLIGKDILDKTESVNGQPFWQTLTTSISGITTKNDPDLYSGVAGICLFLDQLTSITGEPRYRSVANDALIAQIDNLESMEYLSPAFLTGTLGLLLLMVCQLPRKLDRYK